MGITSYIFVLGFLPFTMLGWMILNRMNRYEIADMFLVIASLFFIGSYDYRYVLIILGIISFNYLTARHMTKINNPSMCKIVMVVLITVNVGLLVCLKYGNWFRTLIDQDAVLWQLIVPIGISFYTLEQICYIVDTYNNGEMKYTFIEYVMFSTFFPVILSGPILRHDNFILQIREGSCRRASEEKICEGLISFCLGMGKKVIIASWLGKIVSLGFDDVESAKALTMYLSVLAYALQLYFDFSGYCDIVEGASLMIGFNLPTNFNSPYKAVSIADFWKRWHMTLTSFLTKYVYIPLGGGRKGRLRQYINIFIVFTVSGFWHGTSFTYILWGIMHGICMVIDKIIGKVWLRLPKIVGRMLTFIVVTLIWIPFRAESVHDTYVIYWTLVFGDLSISSDFGKYTFPIIAHLCENYTDIALEIIVRVQNFLTVLFMAFLTGCVFMMKNVHEIRVIKKSKLGMAVICGAILFVAVIQFQKVSTFIYEGF